MAILWILTQLGGSAGVCCLLAFAARIRNRSKPGPIRTSRLSRTRPRSTLWANVLANIAITTLRKVRDPEWLWQSDLDLMERQHMQVKLRLRHQRVALAAPGGVICNRSAARRGNYISGRLKQILGYEKH